MAEDLDWLITKLNAFPEKVGEVAVKVMKEEVPSPHGGVHVGDRNYSTGRLQESIHASYPRKGLILITSDAPHAEIVLKGRKEVTPKHTTKSGKQGWLKWNDLGYGKVSQDGVFARKSKAVPANDFATRTVEALEAMGFEL